MSRDLKSDAEAPPRTAPKLKRDGENSVTILPEDDDQIRQLYGLKTQQAANLLMEIGLSAFGQKGLDYMDIVPALAVEMEPRDAVEAMLINQMAATHYAVSSMSSRFLYTDSPDLCETYERSLTRLNRTFLAQVEGLKKYRAKAQQVVRVERVEVREGGQAIVGSVTHEGGGRDKKGTITP